MYEKFDIEIHFIMYYTYIRPGWKRFVVFKGSTNGLVTYRGEVCHFELLKVLRSLRDDKVVTMFVDFAGLCNKFRNNS